MVDEGAETPPTLVSADDERTWPVDLVVAGAVVGMVAFCLAVTRDMWFFADEWNAGLRGWTAIDFVRPYNGHLSVTWIAIYRGFYGLFGYHHHWMLRLLAFSLLASIAALLYVTSRSKVGAVLAGLAAVVLLWTPATALDPGSLNHWITAAAAVVIAWVLPRSGRRADLAVGGLLALALATSGGGVAVAAACVVHTVIARSTRTRWAAVAVPIVLWAAWWSHWGRAAGQPDSRIRLGPLDLAQLVWDGIFGALRTQAGGSAWLGAVVVVAITVVLAVRLWRGGRSTWAAVVAWGSAAGVWWAGIGWNRGLFSDPEAYRYRVVTLVFLLLALVGSTPDEWRPPAVLRSRWSAGVVLVVLVALVGMNQDDLRAQGEQLGAFSANTRNTVVVAGRRPPVVPSAVQYQIGLGYLTQAQLAQVFGRYDVPGEGRRADLDRELLARGSVSGEVRPGQVPKWCRPVEGPIIVPPAVGLRIVDLGSVDAPVVVTVRRHAREPLELITVPAGRMAQLRFDPDPAIASWTVQAEGACRIGG